MDTVNVQKPQLAPGWFLRPVAPSHSDVIVIWAARIALILGLLVATAYTAQLNNGMGVFWEWLRTQWWYKQEIIMSLCHVVVPILVAVCIFTMTIVAVTHMLHPFVSRRTVYLETAEAAVVYPPLYWFFVAMDRTSWIQQYRIPSEKSQPAGPSWVGGSIRGLFYQFITYVGPLALLDTFTRKHYAGVPYDTWAQEPYFSIQSERVLPIAPPTWWEVPLGAIGAVVIYDMAFYFIHRFVLHNQAWGYGLLHKQHHSHPQGGRVHQGVTNELTLAERIGTILTANAILKAMHAHPLTRNLYVPVYLWLLLESHIPYQPPVWPATVLGIRSNQRMHVSHHLMHSHNYSPFFGIMDAVLGTAFDGGYPEDEEIECVGQLKQTEAIDEAADTRNGKGSRVAAAAAAMVQVRAAICRSNVALEEGESKKDC